VHRQQLRIARISEDKPKNELEDPKLVEREKKLMETLREKQITRDQLTRELKNIEVRTINYPNYYLNVRQRYNTQTVTRVADTKLQYSVFLVLFNIRLVYNSHVFIFL
jgi:hypothetical protein